MIPLIDGDILCYEIAFAAELGWRSITQEEDALPPFAYVHTLLETRIAQLCSEVSATSSPIIYLTGEDNFREQIAIRKGYKANRDKEKRPFHYQNIRTYLIGVMGATVTEGMEADDMLGVHQVQALKKGQLTIICTRDKDLRMIPGWHYSWELGRQPSWGPCYVVDPGYLIYQNKKFYGTGLAWFFAQCLTGDIVDNIPGIPGVGPVKAYKILKDSYDKEDMFNRVYEQYVCHYGDNAEEELMEQGQLLWMTRELDEDNKPILWRFRDEDYI